MIDLVEDEADGRLGKEINIIDTDINSAITLSSHKLNSTPRQRTPKQQSRSVPQSTSTSKRKSPTASRTITQTS